MIKRRFVIEIEYSPKTTFHNVALGDKVIARNLINFYDENYKMDIEVSAAEFVTEEDLSDVNELLHPTKEDEE